MSREGEGVDQRLVGEVALQVGCGIKSDWVVMCLLKAPQLCLVQLEVEEELQGLLYQGQSYQGRGVFFLGKQKMVGFSSSILQQYNVPGGTWTSLWSIWWAMVLLTGV